MASFLIDLTAVACIVLLLTDGISSQNAADDNNVVQMPPQIADNPDPCGRRHHVEVGQTCASVAQVNQLRVSDLLLLNPGLKCGQFFAEVDICVDKCAYLHL